MTNTSQKVAIVVVHGVSDQQPCDSARTIANILLRTKKDDRSRYSVWEERSIRIPVVPIVKSKTERPQERFAWLKLDERMKRIRKHLDSTEQNGTKTTDEKINDSSHAFNYDYINEYDPKDLKSSYYDTICLKAYRDEDRGREIDLYEMYWADLSRLGTGFVKVFSEFYQILFHLSALGKQTLDMAALEYPENTMLWYSRLHGWAGRILSIPIPLLTLFMLVAAFLSLPGNIQNPYLSYLASSILSVLIIAFLGFALWKNSTKLPLPWLSLPVITALLVFGIHFLAKGFSYKLLAFEWLIVLAIPITILITRYSLRRPGANEVALILGAPLICIAFWFLFGVEDSHYGITEVSFKLIEIIYLLLVAFWLLFFLCYFFVVIFGGLVLSPYWINKSNDSEEKKPARERIKRANWTANISLWIPCVAFISVTEALWAVIASVGSPLLPHEGNNEYEYPPSDWFINFFSLDRTAYKATDFFDKLIVDPVFGIALVSIALVILLVAWSFWPSAYLEIRSPNSQSQIDEKLSMNTGKWLNDGYKTVYDSIYWISTLFAFVVIVYFVLNLWPGASLADSFIQFFNKNLIATTKVLALAVTGSASGLLVFGKRLNEFSLGIRNVIDLALDVDNYLRLHPKNDNPRSRIFSRYSSLLRYLFQKNSENCQQYDAVIIVAHSQGTVITADLLRFIQKEKRTDLKPKEIPFYFFSMGSPLRQLYSVAFPHIYNWVTNDRENKTVGPEPKTLGLRQWVNAYCSGDYVGRYLWRSRNNTTEELFKPSSSTEDKDKDKDKSLEQDGYREFCLGAGAHTHYWDGINDRVADEINLLIDMR